MSLDHDFIVYYLGNVRQRLGWEGAQRSDVRSRLGRPGDVRARPEGSAMESGVRARPEGSAMESGVRARPEGSAVETGVRARPKGSAVEPNFEDISDGELVVQADAAPRVWTQRRTSMSGGPKLEPVAGPSWGSGVAGQVHAIIGMDAVEEADSHEVMTLAIEPLARSSMCPQLAAEGRALFGKRGVGSNQLKRTMRRRFGHQPEPLPDGFESEDDDLAGDIADVNRGCGVVSTEEETRVAEAARDEEAAEAERQMAAYNGDDDYDME